MKELEKHLSFGIFLAMVFVLSIPAYAQDSKVQLYRGGEPVETGIEEKYAPPEEEVETEEVVEETEEPVVEEVVEPEPEPEAPPAPTPTETYDDEIEPTAPIDSPIRRNSTSVSILSGVIGSGQMVIIFVLLVIGVGYLGFNFIVKKGKTLTAPKKAKEPDSPFVHPEDDVPPPPEEAEHKRMDAIESIREESDV